MDKSQRIKSIINLLRVKKVVNIKELMERIGVTEMTIRRDLNLLKNDSIVELIPGGAILKTYTDSENEDEKYHITHEETRRTRGKAKIGRKAASLIEPHDTIAIDVGSTTEYIAKFLNERDESVFTGPLPNILSEHDIGFCIHDFSGIETPTVN